MKENSLLNINFVLKSALLLFLINTTVGIIRSEVLIASFDKNIQGIARISSYLSVMITSVSSIMVLLILFLANWFIIELLVLEIEKKAYADAVNDCLKVLMINEGFKFALIWIFLVDDVKYIVYNENLSNVEEQLAKLNFTVFSQYSNILLIVMAILVYAMSLRDHEVRFKSVLSSSSILLLIILLTSFL